MPVRGSGHSPAGKHADHPDHDHSADDGDDDRLEVDHVPAFSAGAEAERVGQETTHESADDGESDVADDTLRYVLMGLRTTSASRPGP